MANKAESNGKGNENIQGYFRAIFAAEPKLLNTRSNDELLARWLKDNPGETEVPRRVKSSLSNLKSVLRSKGRKRQAEKSARLEDPVPVSKPVTRLGHIKTKLESLEEQIDDCIIYARTLDREGLEDVIHHLRRARNAVVWKMGQ